MPHNKSIRPARANVTPQRGDPAANKRVAILDAARRALEVGYENLAIEAARGGSVGRQTIYRW